MRSAAFHTTFHWLLRDTGLLILRDLTSTITMYYQGRQCCLLPDEPRVHLNQQSHSVYYRSDP